MRSSWTATATPAHRKFLDAAGNPAIKPPWDTLATIDLNTGGFRWQVPLGGANGNGAENHGGPLVTAGGLGFIAATKDTVLRAFGRDTGRVAWEAPLPAAVFAMPTSYSIGGEQFVVNACGGGKIGTPRGDRSVAFALDHGTRRERSAKRRRIHRRGREVGFHELAMDCDIAHAPSRRGEKAPGRVGRSSHLPLRNKNYRHPASQSTAAWLILQQAFVTACSPFPAPES